MVSADCIGIATSACRFTLAIYYITTSSSLVNKSAISIYNCPVPPLNYRIVGDNDWSNIIQCSSASMTKQSICINNMHTILKLINRILTPSRGDLRFTSYNSYNNLNQRHSAFRGSPL